MWLLFVAYNTTNDIQIFVEFSETLYSIILNIQSGKIKYENLDLRFLILFLKDANENISTFLVDILDVIFIEKCRVLVHFLLSKFCAYRYGRVVTDDSLKTRPGV